MPQPVKISDALLLEARLAGETMQRSIAGQIEFWARLGKSIEPLIPGDQAMAMCRAGNARPLSEIVAEVEAESGRKQLSAYLESRQPPYFLPHPKVEDAVIRVAEDGTREAGHLVKRVFVPLARAAQRSVKKARKTVPAKRARSVSRAAAA